MNNCENGKENCEFEKIKTWIVQHHQELPRDVWNLIFGMMNDLLFRQDLRLKCMYCIHTETKYVQNELCFYHFADTHFHGSFTTYYPFVQDSAKRIVFFHNPCDADLLQERSFRFLTEDRKCPILSCSDDVFPVFVKAKI